MASGAFDIYQTRSGYTAVDNAVQRRILEALDGQDLQLPELVEITGKSKPTLSAGHMKTLLNRELVEELPHPSDKRRKIYRLVGTRIGSSDIPVPQLRRAVEDYVSLSPVTGRLPVLAVLRTLAAAPEGTPGDVLWEQARHLGRQAAVMLRAEDLRGLWMRFVRFLEEQDVGQAVRIDLEVPSVELEPAEGVGPAGHVAAALAGLAQGMVEALELDGGRVSGSVRDGRIILSA